ncbi:variant erythrocyte surface antigen-1, beta subunit [Babesia caballi]|uniref:Variant erythrocyte surface antigen-1, beta subunit n=1 Tax=Babesia caballi TaxID=5871 RepID=A0AAV4LRU6_BABCB|nr:variant erythrocyte surface antigen-1, beta subunit [Babesia caballi]
MGAHYSKAGSNGPYNSLTATPKNLKEAIDWVLRFSGKDTSSDLQQKTEIKIGSSAITCLAKAILKLLKEVNCDKLKVFEAITNGNALFSGDCPVRNFKICPSIILENLIDRLTESLRIFIGYDEKWEGTITGEGIAIGSNGLGVDGKREHPSPPWKSTTEKKRESTKDPKGYALAYHPDTANWKSQWEPESNDAQICAKNFLIAVTFIFEGLTKLHWECRKGNQWSKEKFNEPKAVRLAGYLVSEGFELDGLYTTYFPTLEEKQWPINPRKQRDNEGGAINGVLSRAFDEFRQAIVDAPCFSKDSDTPTSCSYADFIKALLTGSKQKMETLKKIQKTPTVQPVDANNMDAVYSTFQDYPLTKLYLLAANYRECTDQRYRSTIFKTLSGVTCGAGLGTAAYFTNAFGLGPMIATFFT